MNIDIDAIINQIASEITSRVIAGLDKNGHMVKSEQDTKPNADRSTGEYLDIAGVAKHFNVSKQAVYAWRSKHIGPPYYIINGKPRYKKSELDHWAAKRTIKPE